MYQDTENKIHLLKTKGMIKLQMGVVIRLVHR